MNSKRKARKGIDSSASSISPVEKRAREFNSSISSSPELMCVFEMSESLKSTLDIILTRLQTIDRKLEDITTAMSHLESKFFKLEGRVEKR